MNLDNLKAMAERFLLFANVFSKPKITKLANEQLGNYPGDADVAELCNRMKGATNGDVVRVIAAEYKSRTC